MILGVCIVHWSLAVTDKINSPVRLIIPTQSKCSLQLGNSGLGPIPRHIVKNVFTIHLEIFMIIKVSHIVQCAIMTTNNVPMVKWVSIFLIYRSEEHTSELQSLMRISYAVFCLQKKK